MALWLTEHFLTDHAQELLAAVQRNGGRKHPQLRWFIWRRLVMRERGDTIGPVFSQWTGVLVSQPHDILPYEHGSELLAHCHFPEDKAASILLFQFLTKPRILLKERWLILDQEDKSTKVEFDLNLDRHLDHWLCEAWEKLIKPNLQAYANQLESIVISNLAAAHGLESVAVALGLMPKRALLNDRNPHLIHFYESLKHGLEVAVPMRNEERLFYAHRRRFNQLLSNGRSESAETAALFYYLNRTGFNGLCRFNQSGEFNVPFGDYQRINYVRDFRAYREVLESWEFTSGDFECVSLRAGDFVYADPPYDVGFTQYSKEAFGWDEQVRAAEWLGRHKGPVILSNQATERFIKAYKKLGFKLRFLDAPRRISCTGDRTPAKEVLALRNLE